MPKKQDNPFLKNYHLEENDRIAIKYLNNLKKANSETKVKQLYEAFICECVNVI